MTPKRRRPAAAVLLGLAIVGATFLVHNAASSSQAGGDSAWTTYQSLSLLRHHTLELTEWQDVLNRFPIHWHDNDRHKPVYNFPWGTSVVSAPIVGVIALGDKVGGHSLAADIRAHFAPHHLEKAVASVWVALTTGLVFAFAFRARRSLWVAAIVAVVFAFATSAFSTMSRALWNHGPAACLVMLALLILQAAEQDPDRHGRLIPLLGPLFVLAYAVRPTTAVGAAVLGVVVVVRQRRHPGRLLATAAAGGAALVAYAAVNLATVNSLQPGYYDPNRLGGTPTFLEGLAGNLVSPSRGLLIWSPVLLFCVLGAVIARRERRFGCLETASVVAIGLHWIVVSRLVPWWAGFSTGPRLFSDALPFFVVLLVPAVAWLVEGGRSVPATRWLGRGAFAVLLGWSLFTNGRGATRFETQLWNSTPVSVDLHPARNWDWHDLQFLR